MDMATIAEHAGHGLIRIGTRRSTLVLMLFFFYLIGSHLRLSIYYNGSLLLPMYMMLLSAAVLMLLFKNPLLRKVGISFTIFTAFLLTQPALTLAPDSISVDTFRASLQLLVSVISSLAVIYALSTVDRDPLRWLLVVIWCMFIVLAIVENIGLKPIFDQVREVLYTSSIYMAEGRDVSIYGMVRPTVFASEPSWLADTLSGLVLMIFFLDPQRGSHGSWLRLAIMVAVSFIVSPSFKMAFYLVAVVVWQFWPRNQRGFVIVLGSLFIFSVLLFIFLVPISGLVYQVAGSHLESGSFYGRIGVAPGVGWNVLTTYPIYGYGIGNEEGLYPIIADEWFVSGAFNLFPWFKYLSAAHLMTNGFWWQWVFLGVGGGLVFVKFIIHLLKQIGVEIPLRTLVCVWIVWYAGFAFVDPQSWFVVVIFSIGAVSRHRGRGQIGPRQAEVAL